MNGVPKRVAWKIDLVLAMAAMSLLPGCAADARGDKAGQRQAHAARCEADGADGRRFWFDPSPDDAQARGEDCAMLRFALNNFLYLAGNDGRGHPRFMSFAPWYDAIPQSGAAPRWRDGFKPLATRALRKTAREGQPGDGFVLLDARHRRVGYDVRVNRTFVDYLSTTGLYRADRLQAAADAFKADPATGGVWLPAGTRDTPGAISLKTAWRPFGEETPCPAQTMHCERDANGREWGLIGMHLVQKTPTLGEMTWATFEHVANAPDCAPGGAAPIAQRPRDPVHPGRTLAEWNLFDWTSYRAKGGDGSRCAVPDGAYRYTVAADGQTLQDQTCGMPSATPLCNVDPRRSVADSTTTSAASASEGTGNAAYERINVCRTTALAYCKGDGSPGDAAACLDESLRARFPERLDGKWRYYRLIGAEYMAGHAPGVGCFRYDDGVMLGTTPPRTRFPSTCNGVDTTPLRTRAGDTALANTAMETWMQAGTCLVQTPGATPLMGRDCFACHTPSTNPPGWPFGMGDMSFVFDRVPVPASEP